MKPVSCLLDDYLEYRRETEPPTIFNRWAGLTALSAFLGRSVWLPFGTTRIFPNLYVMFVGDPGTRKSTAIKNAAKIIREAGYEAFAAQKTSKEKWLLDMAGEENAPAKGKKGLDALEDISFDSGIIGAPREMFIAADEFNNFVGAGNLEFLSILGELWDWDDERDGYKYRLKNSRSINIYQPTVTILAGNTPTGFAECFPPQSIGQGFMSRLILVHGEASGKKYTIPPVPSQETTDRLVARFMHIKATKAGPLKIESSAMTALDLIYRTWPELEDQRFKHYSTRRFTHLLKVCILYAVARDSMVIEIDDVIKANTVLAFAETLMPKALGELGKARTSEATNKVMQLLNSSRTPVSFKQIWKTVHMDIEKPADLHTIMQTLLAVEKVQQVSDNAGGTSYLPRLTAVNRKLVHVDQTRYLKGKEQP